MLTPFHLFWIITKTGFLHAIKFKFQALFVTYNNIGNEFFRLRAPSMLYANCCFYNFLQRWMWRKKNCCYLCGNVMTIQGHCKVHLCPKKEVIVNQYQVILSCCGRGFEVGFHLHKTYILVYRQPEITA